MNSSHLNFQLYSVIEISKPKHMMELMCDTKHTFLTQIKAIENIKEILIPPITNKKSRTHFMIVSPFLLLLLIYTLM